MLRAVVVLLPARLKNRQTVPVLSAVVSSCLILYSEVYSEQKREFVQGQHSLFCFKGENDTVFSFMFFLMFTITIFQHLWTSRSQLSKQHNILQRVKRFIYNKLLFQVSATINVHVLKF